MVNHDHGIKCTGCGVQPGECCRHCPAAIAAEEAAAQPNAAMRARMLEILDVADRAGVPLRYASWNHRTVTLQGGTGVAGEMSRDDAQRIASRLDGEQEFSLASERFYKSCLQVATSAGPVSLLCEPTHAQVSAVAEAVLQS